MQWGDGGGGGGQDGAGVPQPPGRRAGGGGGGAGQPVDGAGALLLHGLGVLADRAEEPLGAANLPAIILPTGWKVSHPTYWLEGQSSYLLAGRSVILPPGWKVSHPTAWLEGQSSYLLAGRSFMEVGVGGPSDQTPLQSFYRAFEILNNLWGPRYMVHLAVFVCLISQPKAKRCLMAMADPSNPGHGKKGRGADIFTFSSLYESHITGLWLSLLYFKEVFV